jgi:sec-independent protein translocase protein TatA
MNASLFAVFGLGPMEMMIVGGVALLLFGNRLPSVMNAIGRSFKQFQIGLNSSVDEVASGEVR